MTMIVCGLILALWAAPSPERVAEAARDVLANGAYQTEMPGGAGGDSAARAGSGLRDVSAGVLDQAGMAATLAQGLLYALAIAVAAVLIVWLVNTLLGRSRDAVVAEEPAAPDPARPDAATRAAVVDRPLGDAEALARDGRYGEAIHTLLLHTLQALVARAGTRLPPALTSREILARVALPPPAREALARLVAAAEVSHFGGRAPDAEAYQRCVAQFQAFARAFAGGGA